MDFEEVEALQAMFCMPGELEIKGNEIAVNIGIDLENSDSQVQARLVLHIGGDYPHQFPEISIFSERLDRNIVNGVKSKVYESCSHLTGEPMLISLILCIKETITDQIESVSEHDAKDISSGQLSCSGKCDDKVWTTVLHIDHMRSKNKYCKTLEKWASDLSLCGRILFLNKLILVILQGDSDSIKEYIIRLKTTNVDVDSRGHSCKERLMNVVCQQCNKVADINRISNFRRQELQNQGELEAVFTESKLSSVFEHVKEVLGEKK